MSHGKQFTFYTHKGGPNGWKVAFALEELDLTYESIYLQFDKGEHKAPEFTKYNPNGRIPALIDHANNDFVVWESNAILQYIVDKYDKERKISVAPGTDEYYTQLQWLYFQGTGQGPYYGQAGWFKTYHPEKVPSAVERYKNEIKRVLGVLDGVLSKQEWLVANKPTIADISFIPWNYTAFKRYLDDVDSAKEYPAVWKRHHALLERPAMKKVQAEQARVTGRQ